MNTFKKQFFAGLVVFVPVALTIYFFRFLFLLISQALLPLVAGQTWYELPSAYVRPLSFVLTVLLIWLLGVAVSNFVGRRVVGMMDSIIRRLPLVRGLYEAIQKVTEAFFGTNSIYQSVVLVEYPRKGTYTFAFVTSRMPGKVFGAEGVYLCVFIPTVPNPTSGLLLYVAESEVWPLSISIEEAVKIIVSHGFVPIQEGAIQGKG